jgi:hypothetical protein
LLIARAEDFMLRTRRPKLALSAETIKHLTTEQLVSIGGGSVRNSACRQCTVTDPILCATERPDCPTVITCPK